MSNPFSNWLRSLKFRGALKESNERKARQILQETEEAGAKLSLLQQVYRKQLKTEQSLDFYKRELATASGRQHQDFPEEVPQQSQEDLVPPNSEFVHFIHTSYKIVQQSEHKLSCTGIEKRTFKDFESALAEFLQKEFAKVPESRLKEELSLAINDLQSEKEYNFKLSPHTYLMSDFLDNVYSNYLAWFLVYEAGLMPQNIRLLDIGAGVGTVIYGLALLLESTKYFLRMPRLHISYYSLEKQSLLQLRGLQFWRNYLESHQAVTNTYFRLDTTDILTYEPKSSPIPNNFFDFIVISHYSFLELEQQQKAHHIYQQIWQASLAENGYILLIIDRESLGSNQDDFQEEVPETEDSLIINLLTELGLNLEWYKQISSTRDGLVEKQYLNPLKNQYLQEVVNPYYAVDDYIILARR
ncbi:MAG: hypothetical protein WA865_04995 [Spirulinaceae cyanobacterium]